MRSYKESAALLQRAKKVLAGGVSSEFRKYNHPHALFYTHGQGATIYDVDGNEYLDFTLSQGPLILGHSHPEVLKAVSDYSEKGQLFAGQHIQEIELAEKLNQLIPSAELMRFCLDGSEAVQTAFRVARAKTGRQKFLRFEGALQLLRLKHSEVGSILMFFHGPRGCLRAWKMNLLSFHGTI